MSGDALSAAIKAVRAKTSCQPLVAITLGSGLGGIADAIDAEAVIPYEDIPGFGQSRAAGHRGQLILGELGNQSVVAMAGRYHFYEGWNFDEITFPIQLMHKLGATNYIVSNAAGGVGMGIQVGDLMALESAINAMQGFGVGMAADPENDSDASSKGLWFGPRGGVFDNDWTSQAQSIARAQGWTLRRGTYLAVSGPAYETRAEYRMMRQMGMDAVGMSTAPESLAAHRMGMRVFGLSMISNVANPDQPTATTHEEVIEIGKAAAGRMQGLVCEMLRRL